MRTGAFHGCHSRVILASVGSHTEAIYLKSRLHENGRFIKLHNEAFAISGCTQCERHRRFWMPVRDGRMTDKVWVCSRKCLGSSRQCPNYWLDRARFRLLLAASCPLSKHQCMATKRRGIISPTPKKPLRLTGFVGSDSTLNRLSVGWKTLAGG